MNWWQKNNLRLIQNNIMETDADMDVDKLIERLKSLSVNVLMLNTGGLMAFYPTELEYQYKSPYLKRDLIGEVVQKCHDNDMRYVARFDFSKAHKSIYEKHPEWFYKSKDGRIVDYNDMVHTCVNGYYQREYSLKIIKEAITRYPVDGIFFNMFGYQTRDYSNNYYGICHCDGCKTRFKEMFGEELPEKEDINDKVYLDYLRFKDITVREMLDNIHDLVKGINEDIAISTYTDYKVDMERKESNSAVDRPYPIWLYSASENVKSVEDTWTDKTISNCVINAVDIFYRFMGVSKYLVQNRLYESIASGSGLDFCIIGVFEGYPDEENFDVVKEIYSFHKDNEKYFGNFTSLAKIALIKPDKALVHDSEVEYLGIFKMLKEQHILFDVICQSHMNNLQDNIGKYELVILPSFELLNDEKIVSVIRNNGINILVTNPSFKEESENSNCYNEILGGQFETILSQNRSAYFETSDKNIFKRFSKRNWVFLDEKLAVFKYEKDNINLLPYVVPARYGPPERCGGHVVSDYYGASIKNSGSRNIISMPWQIGYLYYKYGYEDHKNILLDLVDYVMEGKYNLLTDTPKNIEVFFDKYDGKNYLLQLLNLSGFNGTTFYEPNDIYDISITLKALGNKFTVKSLKKDVDFNIEQVGQDLHIYLKKIKDYCAFAIDEL